MNYNNINTIDLPSVYFEADPNTAVKTQFDLDDFNKNLHKDLVSTGKAYLNEILEKHDGNTDKKLLNNMKEGNSYFLKIIPPNVC